MKKTDKHDKRRSQIKLSKKSEQVKSASGWNKPLSNIQQIIFTIITIIVAIGTCVLILWMIGRYRLNSQGYENIDSLVKSYFTAISDNKMSLMKKCFVIQSNSYSDDIAAQSEILKLHQNSTIDLENIYIAIEDCDVPLSDIEEQIKLTPISDAKNCYVGVKITQPLKNNITCEYMSYYYMACYQCADKWFLWTVEEKDTEIINTTDADGNPVDLTSITLSENELMTIGNQFTGYMKIPSTWVIEPTEPSEAYKSGITCRSDDSNVYITMYAMDIDSDAADFATNIIAKMTNENNTIDNIDLSEIKIANYNMLCITCTDTESKSDYMALVFESALHDGYVHYITIETSSDDVSMYEIIPYINTFYME